MASASGQGRGDKIQNWTGVEKTCRVNLKIKILLFKKEIVFVFFGDVVIYIQLIIFCITLLIINT